MNFTLQARETKQQAEYKQHVHTPPAQCTTTIMTKDIIHYQRN